MKTKTRILLFLAPLIYLLDQITKNLVLHFLHFGERISVVPGYLDLVFFRNAGAAFGMLSDLAEPYRSVFFYAIGLVALVALFFFYRSLQANEKLMPTALALILAGLLGNFTDRFRFGSVVDFVSLHYQDKVADFSLFGKHFFFVLEWPAFNVADAAISTAMVLLLFSMWKKPA